VAPSILFSDNVISDDILKPSNRMNTDVATPIPVSLKTIQIEM